MQLEKLEGALEAVLFAYGEPVSAQRLSEILDTDKNTIRKMIHRLRDRYEENQMGIVLLEIEDSYQMATHPDYAPFVRRALEVRRDTPLSQAALEVLAIIAYNQPVSRSFVEQVRGVDSTAVINTLTAKGLIQEAGRMNLPGRPIAYETTDTFLRCFGLTGLSMLPPLPKDEDESEEPNDEAQTGV